MNSQVVSDPTIDELKKIYPDLNKDNIQNILSLNKISNRK